jgi:hypothetical protein
MVFDTYGGDEYYLWYWLLIGFEGDNARPVTDMGFQVRVCVFRSRQLQELLSIKFTSGTRNLPARTH